MNGEAEMPVPVAPAVPLGPAAVQAAPALPAITPLRIKSFTLCDFRAFAGPEPVTIDLDGNNLLIYGENGAGKSSIFHALDEFFALPRPDSNAASRQARFTELRNKFSHLADDIGYVEMTFVGSEAAIRWNHTRHPIDTETGSEQSIVNGAYRKAVLDYRALLETNYRHGNGTINLFEISVHVLLRDYPVVHQGKEERLFDLWQRLQSYLKRGKIGKKEITEINDLSASFNTGLRDALDLLRPKVDVLLDDLGWKDLRLTALTTPGITYNQAGSKSARNFDGREVTPTVEFRGIAPTTPQSFLNEARLSALALAIYFSGRQVCAATLQTDTPRLMILDDVLIGLDQSNRMPVLDLLAKHFKDWQIILLTHDRVWFEMARAYHRNAKADKFWRYAKVHSNDDPTRAPTISAIGSSAASEALSDARAFLKDGHINAAGNYARIANELALREFCERKKVKVAYQQLPDKTPASDLLTAAREFSKSQCNGHYDVPLSTIEMYASILLNQLSHGGIPTVTHHEVLGAINAVDSLLFAVGVVPTGTKQ